MFGNMPLSSFGHNQINQIISELNKRDIKQVTRHKEMSVLRTFMNWCTRNEYAEPINFPIIPKGHYEKFIPPTQDELRAMMAVAEPHIQRVIICGSQCGIRIGTSELFKLTWDNVDFTRGIIHVEAAHKNPSAPWREIPMRQSLQSMMWQWYEEDSEIGTPFIISYKGKQVASIKTAWWQTLKRAGITRRIRPYDLRHVFATELIAAGVDVGTIAKLMGHSSPTMIYNHYQFVMDKQKKAAIDLLPDIPYVPKHMCPNKKGVAKNS